MARKIRTIHFKKNKKGTPILSKEDIDDYAELLLQDFDGELLKVPKPTPVEDYVELYMNLRVDYQNLSTDRSVLGMLAFNDGYVEVFNDNNQKQLIEVAEGTVFIDNSLLEEDQNGRYRFTLGHELGHWIYHRNIYSLMKGQMSIFDLTNEPQKTCCKCLKRDVGFISSKSGGFITDEEWMEWQADYFSSAILMPRKSFKLGVEETMAKANLKSDYFQTRKPNGTFFNLSGIISGLSSLFNVSFQAAAVRMYKLEYIDQKLLTTALV